MTTPTSTGTSLTNLGVVMFTVADQDAALAFYTDKLGFEVRRDIAFGPTGREYRWVEVAPPGSVARLSLNLPMNNQPGGGGIGVETPDVDGEHARLTAVGGVDVDERVMEMPGTPRMFMVRDPDGNVISVVEPPTS